MGNFFIVLTVVFMFLLFFVDVVICSWYGSWIYVVLVIVLTVIVVSIIIVDVISHIVFVVGFNHINDLKSQKVWKNFLEKLFIFHNAYNKGNIFDIWMTYWCQLLQNKNIIVMEISTLCFYFYPKCYKIHVEFYKTYFMLHSY